MVPQEDQSHASEPQAEGTAPPGSTPQPPPANSSLSEVRDYMDWLENQRPPAPHSRARRVLVLVVIVLALSALFFLWRR